MSDSFPPIIWVPPIGDENKYLPPPAILYKQMRELSTRVHRLGRQLHVYITDDHLYQPGDAEWYASDVLEVVANVKCMYWISEADMVIHTGNDNTLTMIKDRCGSYLQPRVLK